MEEPMLEVVVSYRRSSDRVRCDAAVGEQRPLQERDALTSVTLLVPADIGFSINILVLVAVDRRMTVLRSMFVGAVVSGAKAMSGCAIMAAVVEAILVAPMSRIRRGTAVWSR